MDENKLKEENERLKKIIRDLRKQLEQYQKHQARQYQDNYDYLPYEDDDRDR